MSRWTLIALALIAVSTVAGVTAVTRAEEEPLRPETPEAKPTEKEKPPPKVDEAGLRRLVEDLGAEAYDRREEAYRELAKLGEAARSALEKAKGSEDLQVRLSAERLLRRLERRPQAPAERRLSPDRWRERWIEDWLRQLEEDGHPGGPVDPEEWRRELDRRLEEMRRHLEGLEDEIERGMLQPGPGSGTTQRKIVVRTDEETIDCQVDADGKVTVKLTSHDEPGQEKVYEAPSVEEFEERHPDVWERVKGFLGNGGRLRVEIGPRTWPWGSPLPLRPPVLRPSAPGAQLGILVAEITPALRSQLRLAPEEGLLVDEVLAGTLAARLGLERYDIVLRIGDHAVGSPADVRVALAARDGEAPVKVQVVRRGARLELVERR